MKKWRVTFTGEDGFLEPIEVFADNENQALINARSKSIIHILFLEKTTIERV